MRARPAREWLATGLRGLTSRTAGGILTARVQLLLGSLYVLTLGLVLGGLFAGLSHQRHARSVVGSLLVVHGSRGARRLALFVHLGLALLGCQRLAEFAPQFGRGPFVLGAAISVAGALALVFLPNAREGWVGARGVRLGWLVRPWSGVESWRLVGEHLRFRVGERWRAIPVPADDRDEVRRVLEATIPDAESELS